MNWRGLLAASALALSALVSTEARATVVNFDNLGTDQVVPDGYGGITWNGEWTAYQEPQFPYTPSSPDFRIYDLSSTAGFQFAAPVVFDGAFFAGNSYATVQFQMFLAGNPVATSGVLAPTDTPAFLGSGYGGLVDQVRVLSPVPDYFVMDDVTFHVSEVPEPSTWALMLIGFGGLGAMTRAARRRTVSAAA